MCPGKRSFNDNAIEDIRDLPDHPRRSFKMAYDPLVSVNLKALRNQDPVSGICLLVALLQLISAFDA